MALALGVVSAAFAALYRRHGLGFHHPTFRVAIDTAAGIGAFVAAWLMRVRYKQSPSMQSWLLMTGLGCYGLTAFFTFAIPATVAGSGLTGAPVLGRLFAGILLACAGFAGSGPMRRPPTVAASIEFAIGASATCAIVGIMLAERVPHLFFGDGGAQSNGVQEGSAVFVGVGIATVALYLLSGATLWVRARPVNDSTIGWLAIGAILAGISRLDALLLSSASESLVSAADGIRLAATAAFVAASAAEFRRFEQRLADAIVVDERRRLARELHDGVAQNLAFVASHASAMARRGGEPGVMRDIARAAEHAMADSRRAIHLLNRPRSRALSPELAERAYEICSRYGLELDFAMLGGEVHAAPDVEHAVLQIVSEALSNAARHSGAEAVAVQLESTGGGFTVRVHDDGRGFDTNARRTHRRLGGFGLLSMSERARALGGDLEVTSDPEDGGTTVEATFR